MKNGRRVGILIDLYIYGRHRKPRMPIQSIIYLNKNHNAEFTKEIICHP